MNLKQSSAFLVAALMKKFQPPCPLKLSSPSARVGIGAIADLLRLELRARLLTSENGSVDEWPAPHENRVALYERGPAFQAPSMSATASGATPSTTSRCCICETLVGASLVNDDLGSDRPAA